MSKDHQRSYVLDVAGLSVVRCIVDYAFSLEFGNLEQTTPQYEAVTLRVEVPFACEVSGATFQCDPARQPGGLAPALELLRRAVQSAVVDESGTLALVFSGNAAMRVARDQDFESWSLNGPGGRLIVAGPGDRLSIFPPGSGEVPPH